MELKFKRLDKTAVIPKYQTKGSSGFDFHACLANPKHLYSKTQIIIPTGLACVIPEGYEIQIRPRSGLAAKFGITVTNSPGTIDSDYIDSEIKIILYNLGDSDYLIKPGDRIAQGVLQKVEQANIIEIEDFTKEEQQANRGGGFGSTGTGI